MAFSTLTTILLLSVLFHLSTAAIPSIGSSTAKRVRSTLSPRDFVIHGRVPPIGATADYSSLTADATNNRLLSASDTQFRVSTVRVASGRSYVKHYHPRAAEVFYVTRGAFLVQMWDEGSNPRIIRNRLRRGDSTVFPQGLVHFVECVSKVECTFVGVLNSGDPGTVPV